MADVFISYSKENPEPTKAIASVLTKAGYTVWWDTEILGGDDFRDVIDQQLDLAKAVIVVWTEASIKSKWVRAEADHADRLSKLIPLRLETVPVHLAPKPYAGYHTLLTTDSQAILKAVSRFLKPRPVVPLLDRMALYRQDFEALKKEPRASFIEPLRNKKISICEALVRDAQKLLEKGEYEAARKALVEVWRNRPDSLPPSVLKGRDYPTHTMYSKLYDEFSRILMAENESDAAKTLSAASNHFHKLTRDKPEANVAEQLDRAAAILDYFDRSALDLI